MSITKDKIKKILCAILILSMAVTIFFIFSNSLKSPEVSQEQSDGIGDIIANIIPPETQAGSFIQKYLRKIAHFTEHGLLGIETSILIFFFISKLRNKLSITFNVPFLVGFIDESIQMFTKRGPSIEDVWIDIGGFFTFYLLTLLIETVVFLIYKYTKIYIEKNSQKTESDK